MKSTVHKKQAKRQLRHKRVRSIVAGSQSRPRLSVFRSAKHIYAQLIDDTTGKTLVSASTKEIKATGKVSASSEVGKLIAKKALDRKIETVAFDRGGYKYHGRVKAVAEGAREAGLKF